MQPLTLKHTSIVPFGLDLIRPFSFGGSTFSQRIGFYWNVTASDGTSAQGEVAPLEGVSRETLRKAKHDLEVADGIFKGLSIPADKEELFARLRNEPALQSCCPSVRFGVESALIMLASRSQKVPLHIFIGGDDKHVESAFLLQGTNDQIKVEARNAWDAGVKVFKLKVGNRNIPFDVKNVQDLRALGANEIVVRLDANRVWSLAEAQLFVECAGLQNIEFIEEPIGNADRLAEFYQITHMPVALDETLLHLRCGVSAPGRCMPTLANQEGVKAYIIKPVVLGGVMAALDWIEEARQNGKKAIVSSCFETTVGFEMVKAIASLSNEVAGLGTQRFYA